MKVLLISGFFPPSHVAGSEKRTLGYALALKKLGHEVQVLCAGSFAEGAQHWNGHTDDIYLDIPVRRVHMNWQLAPDPNRYLYDNPVVAGHLEQWLAEWQPDVAHIISCYTLSASIVPVIKRHGVPIVITLVDFWFICPRISLLRADGSLCDGLTTPWECQSCLMAGARLYRWSRRILPANTVERSLTFVSRHPALNRQPSLIGMALDMEERKRYLPGILHLVDFIAAPSRVLADMMRAAGIDVEIKVIHSGHDLAWLANMPARQPSALVRFGYIGHIGPQKGVYEMVAAFASAELAGRAELHVYGDLAHNSAYAQRVLDLAKSQTNGVEFHGAFSPDDLGKVLSQVDVTVVPSIWWENNPRVVQESFAGCAPVIASNVGGIAEFVQHEINGLLFERGSIDDLARQMRRVVEDPSLLAQLQAGIPSTLSVVI